MKFLITFLLLTSFNALAEIKMEGSDIAPFRNSKYRIKDLIKDYADLMKLNVTYPSNLIQDETVHIELNRKVSPAEFKKVFYEALSTLGYSPVEDLGVLWLYSSNDMRYSASKIETKDSYPKDASFSMVVYTLKYPLGREIARNMRPFMSRYGRVIDLQDARTIILHERGDNTERLIQTIEAMDIQEAYTKLLNEKPKKDEEDENPLKEKLVELELEKKILEKKYLEIKEGQK